MPTSLGRLLRQWREGRDLSVETVAVQAGIAASTLRRWEQGKFLPRLNELEAVLTMLQVPPRQQAHALLLINKPRAHKQLEEMQHPPFVLADAFREFQPHPGALLQAMRRRSQLTGQQVAIRLGISPSLLSQWETSVALPPPRHQAALMALYQADDEERLVFTREPWCLSPRAHLPPISNDVCEDQYHRLTQQVSSDLPLLGDLRFLQLEAALWPLALKRPSLQPLLARVYHWHGEWLLRRGRFREMGRYAHLAIDMMPKQGTPPGLWLCGVGLAAKHAFEGKGTLRPKQGLEMWQRWLSTAEQAGLATSAYRDMAEFAAAGRQFDYAFVLIEHAKQSARENWDRYAAHHLQARLHFQAGQLQQAARVLERLSTLREGIEESPYQDVYLAFLWADLLIALGSHGEATACLVHAYRLIDSHDLGRFRQHADEIAARL